MGWFHEAYLSDKSHLAECTLYLLVSYVSFKKPAQVLSVVQTKQFSHMYKPSNSRRESSWLVSLMFVCGQMFQRELSSILKDTEEAQEGLLQHRRRRDQTSVDEAGKQLAQAQKRCVPQYRWGGSAPKNN